MRDANALVRGRGAALQAYADNFWTTTEVLAEVKDAESRARLAALPFRLETRRPSPQAVDRVSQFARKTGDLASLSPVDVQVLALAYDLEVEAAGSDDHLRREPEGAAAPCAKKEPAAPRQPAPRPKPRPAAARTAPPPVSWAAAVTAPATWRPCWQPSRTATCTNHRHSKPLNFLTLQLLRYILKTNV